MLLIQEDLKAFGIEMDREAQEYTTWAAAGYGVEYDDIYMGFQRSAAPIVDSVWDWAVMWLRSGEADNDLAFHSDAVQDDLIDRLDTSFDPSEQRDLIRQNWERAIDQVHRIYTLGSPPSFEIWQPWVFNVRRGAGAIGIKQPDIIRHIWWTRASADSSEPGCFPGIIGPDQEGEWDSTPLPLATGPEEAPARWRAFKGSFRA